ncbi:MAG: hypothetical protein FJ267_13265, partial [Planctomycetes bacterium]|nr:hypothetical protein [Planctomycetota bacterium]
MSKILSNGTVDWTSSSALSLSSGINGVMHNLYLFEDIPMLTYLTSAGQVTFAKVSDTTGNVITPTRTTALPGFVAVNVSGSPGVFTEFPWDKLYVSYVSSVTNTLQFQRFSSTLTTVITEDVSELSQYQVGVDDAFQNSYTISRDSLGQIRILGRKNDNTTLFDTVVSSTGQTPALVARNTTLYFLVSKMRTSFSEYLEFTISKASALSVGTPDWTRMVILPVTSATGIRPRLVGTSTRLYLAYARTDGYVYIDSFINSSGNPSSSVRLNDPSSNISELAVSNTSGSNSLIVGTPSSSDVNKVTVTSVTIPKLTVNFSLDVTLGDALTPKTELYVRQPTTSETGDFYVVGKNSSGQYLVSYVSTTGILPSITITTPWNVNCLIANVLGNRLIGCYLFQDYLLLFYVESIGTNDLVCKKIASNGLVSSRSLTVLTPPTSTDQLCLTPRTSTSFANFFVSQKSNLTSV